MDENKKVGRSSKINKAYLSDLLRKIGDKCPPRTLKGFKKNVKVEPTSPPIKPYLTSGRGIDKRKLEQLAADWQHAFTIPENLISYQKTSRIRGNYKSAHTYRSRLDTFKLERLFVPEVNKLPGKSITEDIDPEYYTIVAGRPLKDKSTLQEYKWAVRSCFLTRLQTNRYKEQLELMEKTLRDEEAVYQKTNQALEEQINAFNKFLQDDYESAADWLKKADETENDTKEKDTEIRQLSKEVEARTSRVLILEDEWKNCQLFQKFLYTVAPLQWRRLHDYIQKRGNMETPGIAAVGKFRKPSMVPREDTTSKVARLLGDSSEASNRPSLYFDNPEQLFAVFQEMEEKNRAMLKECEIWRPNVMAMERARDEAIENNRKERAAIQEDINEIRQKVAAEEEKARSLQEEGKIICDKHLRRIVSHRKAITLTACVEDSYERLIGPNDSGLNPLEMMKAIEDLYQSLRIELDILPDHLVERITNACEREDRRIMKEAEEASKKVHQMDREMKKITNAILPWKRRHIRKLVPRSQPPKEKQEAKPPPELLTKEELDERYYYGKRIGDDQLYRPML